MRSLKIDFSAENMLPDGEYIGRMGEHNATRLIITPPAEMAECDAIINYVAAFVTEGKIIRSDFYPKSEQIEIPICAQLTQDHSLGFQLEGYDGNGGLVVKSAVIGELKLLPSAGGDEADFDCENSGMVSQINLNTLARHEHSNAGILGGIGETNGILTYNGEAVTPQKIRTVELGVDSGDAFIEASGSTFVFSFMINDPENPIIPVNADVQSVEYKISGDDKWTDIRSIMKYDISVPVLSQTFRVFVSDGIGYFALVDFYRNQVNAFHSYVMSYQIEKLRVTYAETSAA